MARTRGTVSRATSSRGGHGGGGAASYDASGLEAPSSPRLSSRGMPRPRRGGRRGGGLGRAASARLLEMLQTGDWTSRRLRSAAPPTNQSVSSDDSDDGSSSSDDEPAQAPMQEGDREQRAATTEQPVTSDGAVIDRPGSMPAEHPPPPPIVPPEQTLTESEEVGMKSYTDMVHEWIRKLNVPDLSADDQKAALGQIAKYTSMLPDHLRPVGIYRARAFAATLPQADTLLTDAYHTSLMNAIPRNRPAYHHERMAQCFRDWPGVGWLPPWPDVVELKSRDVLGSTATGFLCPVIARAVELDIERRRLYEPGGVVYEAVLHFSDGDVGKMRWSKGAAKAAQCVSESMGLVRISRTHPSFTDAVIRSKESLKEAAKPAPASATAEGANDQATAMETQDRPPDDAESPATDSSAAGCINVSVSPIPTDTDTATRTRPTTREGPPPAVVAPPRSAHSERRASQEKTLIMFFKRDGGRWTVRRTEPKQNQRPEEDKDGEDNGGRVRKRPRLEHRPRQANTASAGRATARPTTDRDACPIPAESNPAANEVSTGRSLTPSTQLPVSDVSPQTESPTDAPNSPHERLALESIQHQTALFHGLAKSLSKCIPPTILPSPPTTFVLENIDHGHRQIRTLEQTVKDKLQTRRDLVKRKGDAAQDLARVQGRAAKWRADVQRCEANLASLEREDAMESSSPDEEDESDAEERAESRRMRKAALDAVRGRAEHARAQVQRRKEEEVVAGALLQNLKGQQDKVSQDIIASRRQMVRATRSLELLEAREAARTAYLEVGKKMGFAE